MKTAELAQNTTPDVLAIVFKDAASLDKANISKKRREEDSGITISYLSWHVLSIHTTEQWIEDGVQHKSFPSDEVTAVAIFLPHTLKIGSTT